MSCVKLQTHGEHVGHNYVERYIAQNPSVVRKISNNNVNDHHSQLSKDI